LDRLEASQLVVDELIDVAGRATIEAMLELSAYHEYVKGFTAPGRKATTLKLIPA
jgi:hypothetical protein